MLAAYAAAQDPDLPLDGLAVGEPDRGSFEEAACLPTDHNPPA